MNYRIKAYIDLVRSRPYEICEEQFLLCDLIEDIFQKENLYVNEEQLEKYLSYQKYFSFSLLEWEVFCFALHNCVYREDGQLRFPLLFIYVGRGAGKNGYLSFEDFCLLTKTNGVMKYNIDIFAMAEDQAKQSFNEVYDVLETNKNLMKRHFRWTKELIVNTDTKSEFRFRTSNYKTKDGGRPGKVDFDEYHAYENMKLVDVAVTGLGKVMYPRRTIITTDGDVRGGPLDNLKSKGLKILRRETKDNGTIPFMCHVPDKKKIMVPKYWSMANPSLPYFPTLMHEMQTEFSDYQEDPLGNSAFSTKRMNLPQEDRESQAIEWKYIKKCNRLIPDLTGQNAVGGIDYASTTDFVAAGLLILKDGIEYWITHTWVCNECKELSRIRFPLDEAERRGLLTFVNEPEISPYIPAQWMDMMSRTYNIIKIGIDKYKYTLLASALESVGFSAKKEVGNIKLVRPSDEMFLQPLITSTFINERLVWGEDNILMNWYTNNTKMVKLPSGNIIYGKIEPHARKTDGFKAYVAAKSLAELLEQINITSSNSVKYMEQVYTY